MHTIFSTMSRSTALIGAVVCGLAVAGCQTAKEDTASAEPIASTQMPAVVPVTPTPVPSLGSNPNCPIVVTAKSPDAVADPCMTTQGFIQTIVALSERQKKIALKLVAASDKLMAKLAARMAH